MRLNHQSIISGVIPPSRSTAATLIRPGASTRTSSRQSSAVQHQGRLVPGHHAV